MVSEKYRINIKTYPFFTEEEARERDAKIASKYPQAKGKIIPYLNVRGDRDFGGTDHIFRISWVKAPCSVGIKGRIHNHHQYFGFVSGDTRDAENLGGEVEFHFGEEEKKFTFDKNTIIHILPGLVHNPLVFKRVDRPFLWLEYLNLPRYLEATLETLNEGKPIEQIDPSEYGKYIKSAPFVTPEQRAEMEKRRPEWKGMGGSLMSIRANRYFGDASLALGYVNKPHRMVSLNHAHNFHVYLVFLGSDPNNPGELGGEALIYLGQEQEPYIVDKPQVIHMAPGQHHCPLDFTKINRPMIWGEVFLSPYYIQLAKALP